MGIVTRISCEPLSADELALLQRSIECICAERGIDLDSSEADDVAQRAMILFYAGISDESDLHQALRR